MPSAYHQVIYFFLLHCHEVEDEVTVKRYHQTGHKVLLMPENPDFDPIAVDLREQSMTIEGIVVGVIRNSI